MQIKNFCSKEDVIPLRVYMLQISSSGVEKVIMLEYISRIVLLLFMIAISV